MKTCWCLLALTVASGWAATNALVAPVPVPSSPYLPRIYRYVDTLLEDPKQTTNLHHHQNLLRLLYTLSELSAKPKYRDAADAALRSWLANPPSLEQAITRPWLLWNRCYEIAREPSIKFALASLKNQPTNHPGFYLRTWSAAYARTTNEMFLQAIEMLLASQLVPSLSFAIDCGGSAYGLPEPLASRLRELAQSADNTIRTNATPQTAMMYVSRYENTGKVAYRDALCAVADEGRARRPAEPLPPMTLGHAISLQLGAWRSTARQVYLDRARSLADFALTKYFDGTPELVAGIDTLALSLVELHLHILYITAVRYPPNTVDR
jgi:hypothetical protein